ncbi:MAG: RNA polymerase sigma factor [Planctomycetota bacterium]|nr:RNA polymerase sigma factor [Planctomycetota bacterium]
MQDRELVLRAKGGDAEAFRALVEKYLPAVVGAAYSYLGEVGAARDVAQEAFLEAHRSLGKLRDPSRFGQWVYGIARLRAIYLLRRRKRGLAALQAKEEIERTREVETPLEDMLRRERREGIRKALTEIKAEYREVLMLKYVDGKSYEEIAKMLNISVAAVDKRLLRGKEMLREALARYLEKT